MTTDIFDQLTERDACFVLNRCVIYVNPHDVVFADTQGLEMMGNVGDERIPLIKLNYVRGGVWVFICNCTFMYDEHQPAGQIRIRPKLGDEQ